MSVSGLFALLLVAIFPAAMLAAALSDLGAMTISNKVTGVLALAFPLAALAVGLPLETVGLHVSAGTAALLIGMAFFAFGWVGGGDAKLFAATVLWLGPALSLPYVLISSVIGGLLTLALLSVRRMPLPRPIAGQDWALRLHDPNAGVPYGVALAAAGLIVFADSPWLGALGAPGTGAP